jgi:hypothetical protein
MLAFLGIFAPVSLTKGKFYDLGLLATTVGGCGASEPAWSQGRIRYRGAGSNTPLSSYAEVYID